MREVTEHFQFLKLSEFIKTEGEGLGLLCHSTISVSVEFKLIFFLGTFSDMVQLEEEVSHCFLHV